MFTILIISFITWCKAKTKLASWDTFARRRHRTLAASHAYDFLLCRNRRLLSKEGSACCICSWL